MLFYTVASYFDRLRQVSSRKEMIVYLAELFDHATADEAAQIAYLVLGELRPPYEGTRFNLAEKSLIPIAAKVLQEPIADVKYKMVQAGDIGDILVAGKWTSTVKLTVGEMHELLSDIEKLHGSGSQDTRMRALEHLLSNVTPLEAALVVRIINGSLRLGFSDMTIIDAISWMLSGTTKDHDIIERAYNVCADIGRIVMYAKHGGIEKVQDVHITPGIPIRPAAAERLSTAEDIMKKLGTCIAQPKLDGFRVQVHVIVEQGVTLKFFSRNLQRMDNMFPEFVAAFQDWQGESCIIEGEAIAYDEETGQLLPFQETVKRRRKHEVSVSARAYPLRLVLFDVLYAHNKETLTLPHHARYTLLCHIVSLVKSVAVSVIEERIIKTAHELQSYFTQAVSYGLEGLVVKRDDAPYQAGKRNFNWIKIKRQSIGHLEDTIDAVIIGYYAGRGKRARFGIGAFLVAVYNAKLDTFETIAKIGTGLSDIEWQQLKKKCDERVVHKKPINAVVARELEPDVWVAPEYVVEVAADEITLSPLHSAGVTSQQATGFALRFPRMVNFRADKSAVDATTVHEVQELYRHQRVVER